MTDEDRRQARRRQMPKLEIVGDTTVDVAAGTRLVKAVERAGVDIGHRCGGFARCTTCRVEVPSGAPERMTRAEKEKLEEKELLGKVRLACQILVDRDMTVKPLMRVSEQGWPDAGPVPEDEITPEPEWL
jgi:ferredoxin